MRPGEGATRFYAARGAVRPSAPGPPVAAAPRSVPGVPTPSGPVTDALSDALLVAAAVVPPLAVACAGPRLRCGRVAFGAAWLALAAIGWAAGATASDDLARALLAVALPAWWVAWRVSAGRVQDLGLRRWHALWIAVPPANLVWVGWLLVKTTAAGAGSPGAGRVDGGSVRSTAAARGSGPRSADATRTAP